MKSSKLAILYKNADGIEHTRCLVEKWKFHDKAMSVGGQFLLFSISSEKPIPFAIADYCVYRGQYFYLNNLPSINQTAKPLKTGDAFKYDNVRFDSAANDLGRVIMLDVTPTTGDYIAAVGTNYTGSSTFQLYCGETRTMVSGKNVVYTPVCTLAGKIQANLDRAFPKEGWHIHVNLTSTIEKNGAVQFATHTGDKTLFFSNTTVAAALSEVQTTFKLDYFIKGRDVYIGYTLGAITGDNSTIGANDGDNGYFYFGYGKGYADAEHQGKALFEIKRTANQSQQIITRLRAMGSTKNMPHRYYNKEYNLSQSLFPQNLQLPDTFESPEVKAKNNIARKKQSPFLRNVLGDTNDAYLDKNDDCISSVEGLREGVGIWDGSNHDLEEIYPTIKEATYGELRSALCEDMNGFTENKGTTPDGEGHKSFANYKDLERIDEILAIGYLDNNGNLIDNAHIGDGIMPQDGASDYPHQDVDAIIPANTISSTLMSQSGDYYSAGEKTLFVIKEQSAGNYFMAASFGNVWFGAKIANGNVPSINIGYRINVYVTPKSTSEESWLGTYLCKGFSLLKKEDSYVEFTLPALPDAKEDDSQIEHIILSEKSDVRVTFEALVERKGVDGNNFDLTYFVGNSLNKPSTVTNYKSQYRWADIQYYNNFISTPFHVIIKDLGIKDFKAQFNGNDKPKLVMSDGFCVAREFEIGENVKKVSVTQKGKTYKGWQLSLTRASDTSLHTYYPSNVNRIQQGDHYVLIGVVMPSVYIKAAEFRLLAAATQYLADNCETKYTYEPHLDDIYLARNYDRCEKAGDITKSVYWNLYAGLRFPFFGIPETGDKDEILPIINITIESLTIQEGDGITPKVEISLNEKIEQTTYQKITTAIDRIYNGSLFSQLGVGGGMSASDVTMLVKRIGDDRFLSKLTPDVARELITFLKGIKLGNDYSINELGDAVLNLIKSTKIENAGDITTQNLTVTGLARFFKLVIDHIKSIGGAYISSPADGFDIAKVEPVGGSETHPARYRLYWRATDGKRTRANMWEVGDQALSMDFNDAQKGVVMENVSNNYWWSCVLAVSDAAVKTNIDGTEQDCYYIEVSNEGSMQGGVYTPAVNTQGWDAFNKTKDAPMWTGALKPSVGDGVAMLGHRFSSATDQDRRRQSAIYESSYVSLDAGLTAPLKAYYIGIDDFNLSTHRRSYSDAYGSKTVGTFEVVSEGETKPLDEYIAGKAGAVQYRLQIDESVVRIGKDGTMSVTEITPKVVKIENGRVTKTFNADEVLSEGYKITFKTSKDARFHVMEYNHPIALTSDMTMITFHLAARFNSSEVYDTVSIPIIRDGADGGSGYSITCNPASLVFNTNNNGELSASQSKSVSVIVKNGDGPVNITGKVGIEGLVNIAATGFGVKERGVINVNPAHIVVNNGLPATSAGFTINVTLPDATLYCTIPISVNVSKYISQIKSDAESYKSQFDEFTGGETSMRHFKSEVLQTAREISQEVSEKATGGNNLLKDSEFKRLESVSLRFPEAIAPVKNRGYNGTSAIRISKYGLTENQYIGLFWDKQNVVKVEKGATYTFSFYAMSPNPSDVDNVYNEIIYWDSPTGGRKSQLASMNLQGQLTTAYRLFTQTFAIPETAQYEYIEVTLFSLRNGEVYFARPCLTKTDKHTGWSKSKDDMEYIGGNLIRGSQKFDASEFQTVGTLTPNGYKDFTILRLNSSCQYTFVAGEIKPDMDYMLSMWVKSSGSISVRFMATNGATETCRLVENSYGQFTTDPYDARDGYSQLSAQAEFTRVWVHFRTRSTVPAQVRLYITGSGELCGMKLEQGADMTAWTDSRETLTFSLKDFTSYVRQSAREIELSVTDGVNKAGLKLGADGGFTATGRNFKFQDSNGNTHFALTEDGKLKGTLIEANSVTADIIAQPFEEYSTTEEFLQGKKYSWVIRSANIFSGSLKTVLTHQLNGAIVNIHNYTTSSIRFRTTGAYQDSGGNIVFGSIVVHIPPGLLFRAMGIRHLDGADMWVGGKAWPYVGLYPLGRVRMSTTSIGGANYMQLTVISQFEE